MDISEEFRQLSESFQHLSLIPSAALPEIDLYMDQLTTLMEEKLKDQRRYPEDKILTKTMINNYAKNRLLPPQVKKKYSKEHMLMLIYIYYYKNILSINDIQKLLNPLTDRYFEKGSVPSMEDIYSEVFRLERSAIDAMKADVIEKYRVAADTFEDAPEEDRKFLQTFSLICLLSFDVYVKKQVIEKIIDDFAETPAKPGKGNKK